MYIKKVTEAYRYLYETENRLRKMIKSKMIGYYGYNWERIAPLKEKRRPLKRKFEVLYYYELEQFYTTLFFTIFENKGSLQLNRSHYRLILTPSIRSAP